MITREQAKKRLQRLGWSYRRFAALIGRSPIHLAYVLNGQRDSRTILRQIELAGRSPVPYARTGFAAKPFRRIAS